MCHVFPFTPDAIPQMLCYLTAAAEAVLDAVAAPLYAFATDKAGAEIN